MQDNIIADITWDACENCKHAHPEDGYCQIPIAKWRTEVGDGYVRCLNFESLEDD